MPGSIQVSVLDFMELPSSSNAVKVSLGKVEYEAGEKGTFSFPLTNLRDNLIITVHDSEGNQVSHSGVRTISIIEKGTWDDLFPMEGGGLIHMKLQFILSDEERNRIRSMRESAMKKKQEEILNNRLRNAENASPLASSLRRLEVSDVLTATSSQDFQRSSSISGFLTFHDDISLKAAESDDGLKDESFQSQTVPNATDRQEETSSSPMTDVKNKSPPDSKELDKPNLEEQETKVNSTKNEDIQLKQVDLPKRLQERVSQKESVDDTKTRESTDFVKKKEAESKRSDSLVKLVKPNLEEQETKVNNDTQFKQADVPERSQEQVQQKVSVDNTETRELTDFLKKNKEAESKRSDNLVKLDKPNLEEQETKVNSTKDNDIQLKQAEVDFVKKKKEAESKQNIEDKVTSFGKKITPTPLQETKVPERLQESASRDVGSSRSIIAENKSFLPNLECEPDKQGPPEKTPSIRKMISVFESSISQDREPIKPPGMKSYRIGTSRLLKDNADKDYSERSESSSRRLRNSFSTDDLQKNDSGIIKTGEQVGFDDNLVEPIETNIQSKTVLETEKLHKDSTTVASVDKNNKAKSPEEDATVSGKIREEDKESDTKYTENISDERNEAKSLLDDCVIEESHQEKTVSYLPEKESGEVSDHEEVLQMLGNSSPKSSDEEVSNRSIGQVVKIALVVGFGVLVLLFRKREHGKSKKKENNPALKTRVLMNKPGSIAEQLRKIDVLKLS